MIERPTPSRRSSRKRREDGAALAEFAVLSILVWLLLAGVLDLGRAFASQHVLQNAARAAARELSLRELPVDQTFQGVLDRGLVFDEGFLLVGSELATRCGVTTGEGGITLDVARRVLEAADAPVLNRLLLPLWIRDEIGGDEVLRYPGAVVRRAASTTACADGSNSLIRAYSRALTTNCL